MSLTNIVYTPVDTGMANVSKEWDNPNLKVFYLLTGKCALIGLPLRPPQADQGPVILRIFVSGNLNEGENIIFFRACMLVINNY